jgi:hypothetical protein
MVNLHNRHVAFQQVPQPGLMGGVMPVGPLNQLGMLHDYITPDQKYVACPNQDVVDGFGILSLDREPAVVQVPDCTAPPRAATCWSAPAGRAANPRASPRCSAPRPTSAM